MTFASSFGRTFSPTFQPKSQAAASGISAPTDISGLVAWFDFSDANVMFTDNGSTKVSADGNLIYRINDKSGNNYYLAQSTESKRPLYKTNIVNGKSVGSTIGITNGELRGNTFNSSTTGATIFIVVYYTGVGAFYMQNYVRFYTADYYGKIRNYAGSWLDSAPNVFPEQEWGIISFDMDTNCSITQYKNGTSVKTGDAGTISSNILTAIFSSGSANYGIGYVGETVMYSGILASADRAQVETYLNNKWAIY